MKTIHSSHPKFELGDVVQFNSVYSYGDAAAPDTDYTVVEEVTPAVWSDTADQTINGYTKEIALRMVNYRPYDFMLISRKEKGMEVCKIIEEVSTRAEMDSALASRIDDMQVKDVSPITVNITVNADEPVEEGQFGAYIRDIIQRAVLRHGDSLNFGLIGENGPESFIRTGDFGVQVRDAEGVLRARLGPVNDTPEAKPIPVAYGQVGGDGKVKSTGGSSSYYDIPLDDELMNKLFDRWEKGNPHIRTEELIRYALSNDFDYGTSFKSMIRAHAITHLGSGKAGNDVDYELNKQDWSNNKVRERFGKKKD